MPEQRRLCTKCCSAKREPARAEWLLNYTKQHQLLSRKETKFFGFGTTANEALHVELARWTRTIWQMHQTALELELRTFKHLKLLTHNSAS